ncbi:MAG: YdiU family protein [Nitratireductor sp.]|nr:YdiU family protein [Nitratireductor sp.]
MELENSNRPAKSPSIPLTPHTASQSAGLEARLGFEHSYAGLPPAFYALVRPVPVKQPQILRLNRKLAEFLGLDLEAVDREELARLLTGSGVTAHDGRLLAMAYSGHQFGQFNPGLGDGRAALIGEVIATDGKRYDIHLKGSGPTPYSRGGDGRAALGPVMREYIISEAMHALAIPTTRSLAIAATGQPVLREDILPGAVLARVAASHIRVGTFQHFAARGDTANLKVLLDYTIARHYPTLADTGSPALALLEAVIARQAELIARWMSVGFIHGVMNTDNMTVSGETIDYGPCAFLDAYDHYKVYSSIDQQGRYAYGAQPTIAQWNLARLAEALLPLIDADQDRAVALATETLGGFSTIFNRHWLKRMGAKLGLAEAGEDDRQLIIDFVSLMQKGASDFTNCFAALAELAEGGEADAGPLAALEGWRDWHTRWRNRLEAETAVASRLRRVNPLYIARNHLVAEAIAAGEGEGDFSVMDRLLEAISQPFTRREGLERFTLPPKPEEVVHKTFCGT